MTFRTVFGAIALTFTAGTAFAQECTQASTTEPFDIPAEEVVALYNCIEARMAEGYAAGGNAIAAEFRSWQPAATRPAVEGSHGTRFLNTWVNAIGYDTYTEFAWEGVDMPVGSVVVKESFALREGAVRPGPLFIMTKVADGEADEFGNWVYAALQPNGNAMGISQSFCHDCHSAWEEQDFLAYPIEEVRVEN